MSLYFQLHVTGSPDATIRAKKSDLNKFLMFYEAALDSDLVDLWTPAVTISKGAVKNPDGHLY